MFSQISLNCSSIVNRIDDVMVSVLASDAVDHGFELRSAGHTESNLSGKGQVKQAVLRRKSKNWSAGIKKIFP